MKVTRILYVPGYNNPLQQAAVPFTSPEAWDAAQRIYNPCHNCGGDAYGGAICCNTCDESSI